MGMMHQRDYDEPLDWNEVRDYIQDRVIEEIYTQWNLFTGEREKQFKDDLNTKTAYWFGSGDEVVEYTKDIIDEIVEEEVAKRDEKAAAEAAEIGDPTPCTQPDIVVTP